MRGLPRSGRPFTAGGAFSAAFSASGSALASFVACTADRPQRWCMKLYLAGHHHQVQQALHSWGCPLCLLCLRLRLCLLCAKVPLVLITHQCCCDRCTSPQLEPVGSVPCCLFIAVQVPIPIPRGSKCIAAKHAQAATTRFSGPLTYSGCFIWAAGAIEASGDPAVACTPALAPG